MSSIFAMRAEGEVHPLTLSEQIAEHIYLAIVEGEYQLGERIREEEISQRYQVSRGPVREALRILEKDSVVRILPHRGAHVTELTREEVADIFAIRKALIGLAIRDINSIDETAEKNFRQMVERMHILAGDKDEYALASARLHLYLAGQSSNGRLVEMIRSLARQTFRYTKIALSDADARKASVAGWNKIIDLICSKQWEMAARTAEELIDRSCQSAIRNLKQQPAKKSGSGTKSK
jgi:DNA-binding GntR family transcriptional regulator